MDPKAPALVDKFKGRAAIGYDWLYRRLAFALLLAVGLFR
jgi:hypothetical protein